MAAQPLDSLVFKLPIQRLPDEVLSKIFHEVRSSIRLSHVCRGWRTLVIDDPSLWTSINVNHESDPHKIDFCLQRSQSAPLALSVEVCSKQDCACSNYLEETLKHLGHTENLRLECDIASYSGIMPSIVQSAFSAHDVSSLKTLAFKNIDLLSTRAVIDLPNLPALRVLSLKQVIFPRNCLIYNNLTELNISVTWILFDFGMIMINEILGIVESCPNLTRLYLESCVMMINTFSVEDTINQNRIATSRLPPLRDIVLSNIATSACLCLIPCLGMSPLSNCSMINKFPSHFPVLDLVDINLLGCVLQSAATHVGDDQDRDLTILVSPAFVSFISSYSDDNCRGLGQSGCGLFSLSLKIEEQDDHWNSGNSSHPYSFFQFLSMFINSLNSKKNIRRLFIRFTYSDEVIHSRRSHGKGSVLYDSMNWGYILLQSLPTLHHLSLKLFFHPDDPHQVGREPLYYTKRGFMEGFIYALMPMTVPSQHIGSKESILTLCPELRTLELSHGFGEMSNNLGPCLHLRAMYHGRLQSLKLTWAIESTVSDWLDEAQKHVDSVIVEKLKSVRKRRAGLRVKDILENPNDDLMLDYDEILV